MKNSIYAATLLMATSFGAMASDNGAYWGFNMGFTPATASAAANVNKTTGFGMGGHLGYNINHSIAVEAAYNGVGFLGWKSGLVDLSAFVLSGSVLGFYPVSKSAAGETIDVYGKLGYANASVGASCDACTTTFNSKSKSAPTFGFGVEMGRGQATSIRIGMDHYDLSAFAGTDMSTNDYHFTVNRAF